MPNNSGARSTLSPVSTARREVRRDDFGGLALFLSSEAYAMDKFGAENK
jgi:hypothetical protein